MQRLSESLSSTAGGGKLVAMKCDVCNEDEIKSVFSSAKDQFGGIDVCINNAGLAHNAPLLTGDTKDWKNMLDVIKYTCRLLIIGSSSLLIGQCVGSLYCNKRIHESSEGERSR